MEELHILCFISNLKSSAEGHDDIILIKLWCPTILPYIAYIKNFSLTTNIFIDIWKIANVISFPKIKTSKLYKDLRSISILPALKAFGKLH